FSNEAHLLETISQGLYESLLVQIVPLDISIGINKLLSFNENSLRDLYCFQKQYALGNKSEQIQSEISSILDNNKIVTNQQLTEAYETFQSIASKSAAMLPSLTLMELITVSNIVDSCNFKTLKKSLLNQFSSEALNFSQSPAGFAQLLAAQINLYRQVKEGQNFVSLTSLVQQVVPSLDEYLACPTISNAPTQAELDSTIKQTKAANQFIGFADLPSAIYQFTKRNILPPNSATDWPNQLAQYIEKSQACLLMSSASDAEQLQDGQHWLYSFNNSIGEATLIYRPDGYICLYDFSASN
ncbi:MAG: hypothetical protein OQK51_24615, partial [Kangiellaceae bacterium]|nr:hypothetical protein [Kangiellaceae bacterium]